MTKNPPCHACEWGLKIELLKENSDVWELWQLISTQWRTSYSGIIGLDYPAVFETAKIFDIPLTQKTFLKLQRLEMEMLSNQEKASHETGYQNIQCPEG